MVTTSRSVEAILEDILKELRKLNRNLVDRTDARGVPLPPEVMNPVREAPPRY